MSADRTRAAFAWLLIAATAGCGEAPPAPPDATHGLRAELDGRRVAEIPVFADPELSEPAFTLAPTERVRILESRAGRDPSSGSALTVYRVAHAQGEGWVAAYWLQR